MTKIIQYNVAQICEKGHLITDRASQYPYKMKDFCDKCGRKTLLQCTSCRSPIPGVALTALPTMYTMPVPSNCTKCGKAFPWKSFWKWPWKIRSLILTAVTVAFGAIGTIYTQVTPVKNFVDKKIEK
ncbi:MAG: DUF2321 domain-containing protein [Cyanobacteria bacterium REEB67]|nr:DUF2321 domain-containing protein [Cyanobacteria bacterium REEB67]